MDLKAYYRKIRETQAAIEDEFPVIKSLASEGGGKRGVLTEAPRALAAKMLVDGAAELASAEEAKAFREKAEEEQRREMERRKAEQVQFTVLTESDLRALQRSSRGSRKD